MPRCQGRPDTACPGKVNNASVKLSQGDLMLCRDCELFRFPYLNSNNNESSTMKASKSRSTRLASASSAEEVPVNTAGAASRTSTTSSNTYQASDGASDSTDVSGFRTFESAVSISCKSDGMKTVDKILCDEVLAYVSYYRDSSTAESIRRVVLTFFSVEDICSAKKMLAYEFSTVLANCPLLTERRSSAVRQVHEAEVEDIIGIFDVLDTQHMLDRYVFTAIDLRKLPKFAPEESNLGAVAERQVQLESSVEKLMQCVSQLQEKVNTESQDQSVSHKNVSSLSQELDKKLTSLNARIDCRLEQISAVCRQSLASTSDRTVPGQRAEVDRSMNIVVFGIAEDRNAAVWRQSVQNALDHVSSQHVDIVDLHRVGRYDQNKMRPIVVKLRSGWDRRILLSRRSTLRTYPDRVFLAPDESLDVRRQHTLDRLKARAERAGQSVSVSDGILSVDGVEVFSLSNGHANRHG